MIFETERLVVRKLVSSDFNLFHEMQADETVMQFITGHGFDAAENLKQLQHCINCYSNPGNRFWVWAIDKKIERQFIGTCAVVPHNDDGEIGYRLLKKHFGFGYGQEICDGLIEYSIHNLGLRKIVAVADVRNVASIKILNRSVMSFLEEVTSDEGITDRYYCWENTR